jgi:hypothetical protein
MDFPSKVFEDIEGSDFEKHNKKQVTEDFVTENFKEIGWSVYRPVSDTGIDLIAIKRMCPKNHTKIDTIYADNIKKCEECGEKLIQVKRFIQVKARELKGDPNGSQFFGYTLASKHFRTDPRHVILLYSDYSDEFLLIPMYEYLKIFHENESMGKSHFGTPAFRQGNNKLNSLRKEDNQWSWKSRTSKVSFDEFVNAKGLKKISNCDYDIRFNEFQKKITEMKFDMFFCYSRGKETTEKDSKWINGYLTKQVKENKKSIKDFRDKTKKKLSDELPEELKRSILQGYLVKFKGMDFE